MQTRTAFTNETARDQQGLTTRWSPEAALAQRGSRRRDEDLAAVIDNVLAREGFI